MDDKSLGNIEISVVLGDITELEVDAIVNAANSTLLGGGGVDGAIHRAAGPELAEYCRNLNGCETGEAKITPGFELPVRYVIHTVGPIYGEEDNREEELLYACYRNSLEMANKNQVRSIAFPAISTGVFRFPLELASEIAVRATRETLRDLDNPSIKQVIFVVFSPMNQAIYKKLVKENL